MTSGHKPGGFMFTFGEYPRGQPPLSDSDRKVVGTTLTLLGAGEPKGEETDSESPPPSCERVRTCFAEAGCAPARTGAAMPTADRISRSEPFSPLFISKRPSLSGGTPFRFKGGGAAEVDFCMPPPQWHCGCERQRHPEVHSSPL
eukprot:1589585-Amphidinium_carterae.2